MGTDRNYTLFGGYEFAVHKDYFRIHFMFGSSIFATYASSFLFLEYFTLHKEIFEGYPLILPAKG